MRKDNEKNLLKILDRKIKGSSVNIQSSLRKLYNTVNRKQIDEKDITAENFSRAAYMAGMLDSAKIFIKLYNGELSDEQFNYELNQLEEKPND